LLFPGLAWYTYDGGDNMKRIVLIAAVIALLCAGTAFAKGPGGMTGIGVYGTYGFTGGGGGLGFSLKFGSFPVIGLKYNFSDSGYIGATVDWYVLDSVGLIDSLTFFLGPGLFLGLGMGDNGVFDIGIRFPVGLQLWVVRKLELFVDLVPAVPFLPTPRFNIGCEVGFRFHF
jgi:hypothetical protein